MAIVADADGNHGVLISVTHIRSKLPSYLFRPGLIRFAAAQDKSMQMIGFDPERHDVVIVGIDLLCHLALIVIWC